MTLDFLPEKIKLTYLQWIHIIGSNVKHKPPALCKISEAVTLEKEESEFFRNFILASGFSNCFDNDQDSPIL